MRISTAALAAALPLAALAAPAGAASGRDGYDMQRFLEQKHPFPGTYATPSRITGARPNLPRRDLGAQGVRPADGSGGGPSVQAPAEPEAGADGASAGRSGGG